ncbi:Zinc finger CCCH domain-containing protein 22 [Dichanthelium oligosanthes]|uniref:Zinc finger CCCH domain-containing protein 22 n=1 Tax=Dichanthelium oligosanthes TaxID=888268 RepID=A0A1E5ULS2_9POAL|nr:Zinc finger CCCH domain-containing protein 22 [Dichanthelium oligosanthes]
MDTWEATKVVFDRVRALDPDNASKIMGLLLIQDNSVKDLIRLAFGPEHLLHAVVASARAELDAKPASPPSPVLGPLQTGHPWGLTTPGGGGGDHQSPFAADHDAGADAFYPEDYDCWSPADGGHRRSFSLGDEAAAAGAWRPCMYFARGFCKNGSSCRFLHGLPEDDAAAAEREMVVMRAKALAAAARPQQLMASAFPFSPSPPKGVSLNSLLQQQKEPQRAAAAAAMLLGGGEDMHRFPVRSPRMDRGGLISSPAARQIYLTFPADSTFSEEDVSNYFSMYGPVQDVRIPYQQKRMFGFVTFVYAETVKAILSKGNPHFVCDARVLVKPYKEKGNVPDRFRKLQHPHHGDFAGCTSPTGLLDSRDPFDLSQPQIGPRMMYGNIANHEAFLRRKIEEQQQVAELQQAIELEGRRFMGLQLLDLTSRGHHLGSSVGSPMSPRQADGKGNGNGNAVSVEDVTVQDNKMNSGSRAMSAPATAATSATGAEGEPEEQQEGCGDGSPKQAVNPGEEGKRESVPVTATPNAACGLQESHAHSLILAATAEGKKLCLVVAEKLVISVWTLLPEEGSSSWSRQVVIRRQEIGRQLTSPLEAYQPIRFDVFGERSGTVLFWVRMAGLVQLNLGTKKAQVLCKGYYHGSLTSKAFLHEPLPPDPLLEVIVRCNDVATIIRCAATDRALRRAILDPDFHHRLRLRAAANGGFDPDLLVAVSFRLRACHGVIEAFHSEALIVQPAGSHIRFDTDLLRSFEPVSSRDGLLVLLRNREGPGIQGVQLLVCNTITGHATSLPTMDLVGPAAQGTESGIYRPAFLSTDGGGRSFELLVMYTYSGNGILQPLHQVRDTQIFSSQKAKWGATRKIHLPQGVELVEATSTDPAIIERSVHWLCKNIAEPVLRDNDLCILALHADAAEATAIKLPQELLTSIEGRSSRGTASRITDSLILAATEEGKRLNLVVAEKLMISVWTLLQDEGSSSWSRQVLIRRLGRGAAPCSSG